MRAGQGQGRPHSAPLPGLLVVVYPARNALARRPCPAPVRSAPMATPGSPKPRRACPLTRSHSHDKPQPETPRLRDSETPRLRDSEIPRFRDSETPSLLDSETPRLRDSETPRLRVRGQALQGLGVAVGAGRMSAGQGEGDTGSSGSTETPSVHSESLRDSEGRESNDKPQPRAR